MRGILNIYGTNVVTTEGSAWRFHRKITSRPFSEKNNQLVHDESVRQAQQMSAAWEKSSSNGVHTVLRFPSLPSELGCSDCSPHAETMKFALHVIARAGFGVPFSWDVSTDDVWPNHTMSFRDAISSTLSHLIMIMVTPKPLLDNLPFATIRDSRVAYYEFGRYMRDLLEREKALGEKSTGQNLLAALVKYSADSDDAKGGRILTDDEIIGNTFLFLIAGHETTYQLFLPLRH